MADGATSADTSAEVAPRRPGGSRGFRRLVVEIAVALVLVMLVRGLVAQSFFVPSPSMEPTVMTGDRVVVLKTTEVRRGDVIVFDGSDGWAAGDRTTYMSDGLLGRTLSSVAGWVGVDLGEQDFLKRVVAVGGDRVSCTPEGGLVVAGEPVEEPYLPDGMAACTDPFDVEVPAGRLFVLGDNRAHSSDSRARLGEPGGGTVPVEDVVGTVELRYWPLGDVGSVD